MIKVFLLTILFWFIIPPIINGLVLYITLKYNLWNWVTKMAFRDGGKKLDKDCLKACIIPGMSSLLTLTIVMCGFMSLFYFSLIKPFEILFNIIGGKFAEFFQKIENRKEFFEELSNHKTEEKKVSRDWNGRFKIE